MNHRVSAVVLELKHHIPFTVFGAVTGVACMLLLRDVEQHVSFRLFRFFHPTHVLLSALVTASLFKMRQGKTRLLTVIAVGYLGSIGVATLSDCVVPFLGENILGVAVPTHADLHEEDAGHAHEHIPASAEADLDTDPPTTTAARTPAAGQASPEAAHQPHLHLGFIEEWYVVNPLAFLGIFMAWFIPHEHLHTKVPHAAHVLISTWASSFHILMNTVADFTLVIVAGSFIALFVAVWLPCCISDIVFPVLFVGKDRIPACCIGHHHTEEKP